MPPKTTSPRPHSEVAASSTPPLSWLTVYGARQNNLKNIDVSFPLGALSVVTGVSGSGKSSLVNDILWKSLARTLHRANTMPGVHDRIDGVEFLNKVIRVDQQPIGQTPTSNPATYTGLFELIRELFAFLPESKLRGFSPRRFSFNVPGGRCEKCEGAGQLKIEMHFLPDVWITCDACGGKRYDRQTLDVKYRGYSIADVLEMSCGDAVKLFENIPGIRRILTTLCDVGLDYLSLGQAAPTLSGGEAQRVKLASELARPDTGRTLYLLDEPTTGLHFDDLQKLLDVLHRLVDLGNTAIVIEHNLDVIKNADWIVDLGPEAGIGGGSVVFQGTPEELRVESGKWRVEDSASESLSKKASKKTKPAVKKTAKKSKKLAPESQNSPLSTPHSPLISHTATALMPVLLAGPFEERGVFDPAKLHEVRAGDVTAKEVGAEAKMPWEIDGPRWHTKERIGRRGKPVRWDGRILAKIVRHIEQSGGGSKNFAPTDWSNRSIVEIRAEKKSLGWFFHAITAEEWLLKMKFRTARNTFQRNVLVQKLDLKPLNDMDEIPLYGTEPRVRILAPRGPWQEIELRVHSLAEVDKPEFWDFLDLAIQEFAKYAKKEEKSPSDLMPWKILGEKWHYLPKGLVGGDRRLWDASLLRELFDTLTAMVPEARIVWTNKVLVPVFRPQAERVKKTAESRKMPWCVVHSKRVDALYLDIYVPKNAIPLGSVRSLGFDAFVNGENESYDIVQLKLTKKSLISGPVLKELLQKTL